MRWPAAGLVICLTATGCSSDNDTERSSEHSRVTTAVARDAGPTPDRREDTEEPSSTPPTVVDTPARTTVPATSAGTTIPSTPPDIDTSGELGTPDATIVGDRGTLLVGDVDVPAGLDAAFPLPEDLTIALASEVGEDLGFTASTALGFDDAVTFFRDGLTAAGYTVTDGQFVDGVVAVFAFDGPAGSGDVALSASPRGGTDVIVAFAP